MVVPQRNAMPSDLVVAFSTGLDKYDELHSGRSMLKFWEICHRFAVQESDT